MNGSGTNFRDRGQVWTAPAYGTKVKGITGESLGLAVNNWAEDDNLQGDRTAGVEETAQGSEETGSPALLCGCLEHIHVPP